MILNCVLLLIILLMMIGNYLKSISEKEKKKLYKAFHKNKVLIAEPKKDSQIITFKTASFNLDDFHYAYMMEATTFIYLHSLGKNKSIPVISSKEEFLEFFKKLNCGFYETNIAEYVFNINKD